MNSLITGYSRMKRTDPNFRKVALIGFALAACSLVIFGTQIERTVLPATMTQTDPDQTFKAINTQANSYQQFRPVIKTFFQSQSDQSEVRFPDDPILRIWKEEWEQAGFEAQVVTLADAKKHPYYDTMKAAVEKTFGTDIYHHYRFLRYLAMATTGGGWFSEYDTMPINFPIEKAITLPSNGQFTSYTAFVPALISASGEEWTRVAQLITEQLPKTKQSRPPSDMIMLKDFYEQHIDNIDFKEYVENYVRDPRDVIEASNQVRCEELNKAYALHFSHSGKQHLMDTGRYPTYLEKDEEKHRHLPKYRALAIKRIMNDWREQCTHSILTKD
jgi:hypothetical protein